MYHPSCILVMLTAFVTRHYVSAVTPFTCVVGNIGFYANPDECSKYYICTGERDPTPVSCAPGLLFSTQTKSCDYSQNVNCNGRHSAISQVSTTQRPIVTVAPIITTKATINTNAPATNAPLQTGRPSFTNAPQPTFLPVTNVPTNSPFQTYAPLQTNAPVTYVPLQTPRPTTNAAVTQSQTFRPAGFLFPLLTNTARPTNAPIPTTTRAPTNSPVFLNPNGNVCFGIVDGYFLDPKDCGYYYQCSYGQAVREPCPPRLVFNEKTNACDYAQNVPACSQYQGRK